MTTSNKLQNLQYKLLNTDEKIRIMIIGLGSVGLYLLEYLSSLADPRLEFIVIGRNLQKMQSDVNIIRTAATIRHQYRSKIIIDIADLNEVETIFGVLKKWKPDFIVNSSRVYAGLKYGSISWSHLRAYGIWTPLSVKYAINIMEAYRMADANAIAINTSYSDAVIPWLKSAGMQFFDFGSGNLNHLIPRMKFYISEKLGIENTNDIDITLATSHFHDVVISKEGHSEGQDILIDIKYNEKQLNIDKKELLSGCKILMPTDQKRNMMNASSNFDIINSIMTALRKRTKLKIHTPGVNGEIGGYPYIIDGTGDKASGYIDESVFSLKSMRQANRESIYLDGIYDIKDGHLTYTPELIERVTSEFGVSLKQKFNLAEAPEIAQEIIEKIIIPQGKI